MHLPRHRVIFIHIPKTAGNFIQQALLPYSDDRLVTSPKQDGRNRFDIAGPFTPKKHAKAEEYRASMGAFQFSEMRIMTCIRHPFERMLSHYFSPHRWVRVRDGRVGFEPAEFAEDAFRGFVQSSQPMATWLRVGGVLRRPDFLIRFEHLREDVSAAFASLDIPLPEPFEALNRSPFDKAPFLVRADLEDIVLAHHGEDYEAFGYRRRT